MKKLFFVAFLSFLTVGSAWADSDLMSLIGDIWGDDYAAISNSGSDKYNNASSYNLSTSDHNSFVVDYGDNGVIRGHGRCSTRNGTDPWSTATYDVISTNFVDNLTNETGQSGAQYCYCGLDSYTPVDGSAQSLSGPWVLFSDCWDGATCAETCADRCADNLANGIPGSLAFRAAMFNSYAPSSSVSGNAVTTQTYVDNALNTKQAKITTTGTNKLMTYGSSTGATPGSRDIVTALGTSTSATTVPTVGPIVTAVNNKQNAVNGTADYVMTGTGTAGRLGEKPVYSASVQKSNALVTAQTINTVAMDAANSEMMCHSYVANASQTPENCLLWAINSTSPTGLEIFNLANIIGTTQMTALTSTKSSGETNRGDPSAYGIAGQSSAYAIDFGDKGVVKGYGRCSTQSGTNNSETWSAPTIFADLIDETGQSGARYCYCTLTSYTPVGGSPRSLSGPGWVYFDYWSGGTGASNCASSCANNCGAWSGNYVSNSNKKYRAMMYNAYD